MEFEILKKSHLKRNIIIGVVAVLIISAIVLTFTRAKYRLTQSIPLVNGTINYTLPDIQIIGLYIDGKEAEELDSTKSYTLDTINSTCTYKDGTTIDNLTLSYDSNSKTFTIAPYTTRGTKCILYFKEIKTLIETIADAYQNNTTTMAIDDTVDQNLRYFGASPNNYIYFNCDDYSNQDSATCELWHIIGIMNNIEKADGSFSSLVKITKDSFLEENKPWNSDNTNDWSNSTLQTDLNGYYLYGGRRRPEETDIKNDETRNMIESVVWHLGGKSDTGSTLEFYEDERGTTVYSGNPTTWTGKVALIYPSDYGYAAGGGTILSRETCLNTDLVNWRPNGYEDCYSNNYIYNDGIMTWTLTPSSESMNQAYWYDIGVYDPGNVIVNYVSDARPIKPAMFLIETITVSSGEGTITNPYQLQM